MSAASADKSHLGVTYIDTSWYSGVATSLPVDSVL
jgi:hypothetical protein